MANRSDVSRRLQRSLVLARKQSGWSQRALAERAGVSVHTVQKLEAGRSEATLVVVERIADALRVPVAKLLSDGDESGPLAGWTGLGEAERALTVALVDYFVARRGPERDERDKGGH